VTESMRIAIDETDRRRALQAAYNVEHGITPQSIVKQIDQIMSSVYERDYLTPVVAREAQQRFRTQAEVDAYVDSLKQEMKAAAANLDFEKAAALRDRIKSLRDTEIGLPRVARRSQAGG